MTPPEVAEAESVRMTLRLRKDLHEGLLDQPEAEDRSLNWQVNQAVDTYLERRREQGDVPVYPLPLPDEGRGARYQAVLVWGMPGYHFPEDDDPESSIAQDMATGRMGTDRRIESALAECQRVLARWGAQGAVQVHSIHSFGGDQLPVTMTYHPTGVTTVDHGARGSYDVYDDPSEDEARASAPVQHTEERLEAVTTEAYKVRSWGDGRGGPVFVLLDGQVWQVMAVTSTNAHDGNEPLVVWKCQMRDENEMVYRTVIRQRMEPVQVLVKPADPLLFEGSESDSAPSAAMQADLDDQFKDTLSFDAPDAQPEEGTVRLDESVDHLVARTPAELADLAEQAMEGGIDLREQHAQEDRLGQPDISPSEDAALRARQEIRSERAGNSVEDTQIADATRQRHGLSGVLD